MHLNRHCTFPLFPLLSASSLAKRKLDLRVLFQNIFFKSALSPQSPQKSREEVFLPWAFNVKWRKALALSSYHWQRLCLLSLTKGFVSYIQKLSKSATPWRKFQGWKMWTCMQPLSHLPLVHERRLNFKPVLIKWRKIPGWIYVAFRIALLEISEGTIAFSQMSATGCMEFSECSNRRAFGLQFLKPRAGGS